MDSNLIAISRLIYFCFLCSALSGCLWEEPGEASSQDTFVSKVDFLVSPDTSVIHLNDTFWVGFEASNIFIAPTGKTKIVSDVNTTMPVWVYRINTGSTWIRASIFDCGYVPLEGNYTMHTGTNSISYVSAVYYNSKYHFKMGFVPHVADTFFIQVKPSMEQRKGEAFTINPSFSDTKQNLDLITPHDYWNNSPATRAGLYAFIVN